MNPNIGRSLRWLLTLAIIVLLVIFARTIDWSHAWQAMRTASPSIFAFALAINFLSVVIKGVRWWFFLKPAGSPSLALAIRATIAGSGLNNVLVANGGEAARVVFVSRATGIPSSKVLATLALERMFDPVGFVILVAYATMAFSLPHSLERWRSPALIALVLIAVLLTWLIRSPAKAPVTSSTNVPKRGLWNRLKAYLAEFASSARELATAPRFAAALFLSLLAWTAQVVTFKYTAAAAHVPMSTAASIATLIATNLGLLIRATPGNVGFFQFVFALTAAPFGIARSDAIAVSLLIQLQQIVPVTLVGVLLAPEFIFRRARGSGGTSEESDELARTSRQS